MGLEEMSNELLVSYDGGERVAQLDYRGDPRVWPAIRRVCQDSSELTELTGAQALRMPWWAFLGCRKDLEYQSKRFSFEIRADRTAQQKIAQADEVGRQYAAAVHAQALDESEIVGRLKQKGFARQLKPEQIRNVARLANLPSAATFSVPGAGKTTEALAFFTLRREPASRLVVVCPKNAFAVWEEQLALCLPNDAQFVRLRGGSAAIAKLLQRWPNKVLVTYQQLPTVTELVGAYVEAAPSCVFLDESHRIKRGLKGVIGNKVLSFAELPKLKLILSGTPMPNDIQDLVPQFRFLFPEIVTDETTVKDYIKPVYVRTTKKELNLPPLMPQQIRIPLRPAQFELYELLRSEVARELNKRTISTRDRQQLRKAGRSALRLLQVVSNPGLLARIPFEHPDLLSDVLGEGDSPKLEYACYRARELAFKGEKSIIWSSFVDNVELVANRLRDLKAEFIHGGVDAGDEDEEGTREQKIKRFHEDKDCYVLVANPAACGEGISLHTVCHHAIYLDRNYNAGQFMQSQDRIHRLGLKPHQITYTQILVAPRTVDESVERRLVNKIRNMEKVLGDSSIHVEPEIIDLDADGFMPDDLADFVDHIEGADSQ